MHKQWGYSMVKAIRNDEDLDEALTRIEEIFNAEEGTPEDSELAILLDLVEVYESRTVPIPTPSPVAAIEFMMDQRGLTQRDLIPFVGSASKVSEVLSGKRDITMAMARALHKHLGIPAESLLGDSSVSLGDDDLGIEWSRFPLKQMAERGWIDKGNDLKDRAEEIMRGLVDRAGRPQLAAAFFRKTYSSRVNAKTDDYALAAWCLQVMALANESAPAADYKPGVMTADFMRDVSRLSRRTDGPRQAQAVLADNGISLQIVPHLPKTYLDGAAIWMNGGQPVIGMTLRHDRIDNFWFTLLHELAHLGLHLDNDEDAWFVDDLSLRGSSTAASGGSDPEAEADMWAEDALTPLSNDLEAMRFEEARSPMEVMELAQKFEVHPAVIAGRVRYEQRNYRLLSQFVGSGEVRKQFEEE